MAKSRNFLIHLTFSFTIMIVLITSNPCVCGGEWDHTCSIKAFEEADAVASIPCSGHGRIYLDATLNEINEPICECNQCYSGHDCSNFSSDCALDAKSGNMYVLEPFWMKHAASSAILISGWHRMGYTYNDGSFISKLLVKKIQKLHDTVGNAVTEGRYIVFGSGSTQILNAAIYALSSNSSLSPAKVVVTTPSYQLYKTQTQLINSTDYKYIGDTSSWKNNVSDSSTRFIEFVTSPTNPEGKLTKAVLHGPNVKTVYDHAYYWPHFTPISSPANEDFMVFTISKVTGHAGSRFGWALIKDKAIYEKMSTYLEVNSVGVSRDTQLRILKLLDVVLEEDATENFQFVYTILKDRWARLKQVISKSKRFSVQKLSSQYCTFFKKVRDSTPAFAWFKCERQEDMDCYEILKSVGINSYEGNLFGVDNRYVRLTLMGSNDDFDILINKLSNLTAEK